MEDQPTRSPRTSELAVSVLLIVVLVGMQYLIGMFALFSMIATDSCYGGPGEPLICSDRGETLWFIGLAVLIVLMVASIITAVVMVTVGYRRDRRMWTWPVLAIVVTVIAAVGFFGLVAYLAA